MQQQLSTTKSAQTIESTASASIKLLVARRKFNTYFLTFWHTTHLASCNKEGNTSASWEVVSLTGNKWKNTTNLVDFISFDRLLYEILNFISVKLRHLLDGKFSKASITVVDNYDKCLEAVEKLDNSAINDEVDAVGVCATLIRNCCSGVESFKKLPFSWNYLFVTRIHQLLVLAKDCCSEHDITNRLKQLDLLFVEHDSFTTSLRKHFTTPTLTNTIYSANESNAVDFKLFQPQNLLGVLTAEFDKNAKCQAERIPLALTGIIHDYCWIDPFNPDDMDAVKTKIVELGKIK